MRRMVPQDAGDGGTSGDADLLSHYGRTAIQRKEDLSIVIANE